MSAKNGKPKSKDPPDKKRIVTGDLMDKVEVYGWVIEDKPGKPMMLSKRVLHVDHDYQRNYINWNRVNRIASRWSWAKFLRLGVALRPDGTYWVFEGQHRKLAADKRSDIDELPCEVFKSLGPVEEAKLFLGVNDDRGSVQMIDKFNALLAQKDETAEFVDRMVRADGYKIGRGNSKFVVQCAGALYRAVEKDRDAASAAWGACAEIYGGETVHDRVFNGLYGVQKHLVKNNLGGLLDSRWRPIVRQLTHKAILNSIAVTAEFYGKGGPKIAAEGVVRLINKRRRTNTIPSLFAETDEHVESPAE